MSILILILCRCGEVYGSLKAATILEGDGVGEFGLHVLGLDEELANAGGPVDKVRDLLSAELACNIRSKIVAVVT